MTARLPNGQIFANQKEAGFSPRSARSQTAPTSHRPRLQVTDRAYKSQTAPTSHRPRLQFRPYNPAMWFRAIFLALVFWGSGACLAQSRVLLDAHNCYPSGESWTDRIDRALSAGTPLAIEQDL